jgi:hypothetical protein
MASFKTLLVAVAQADDVRSTRSWSQLFYSNFPDHIASNVMFRDSHFGQMPAYSIGLPNFRRDARLPFHLSIIEGDLAVVQQWLLCHPEYASTAAMDLAARAGQLHVVEFFHNRWMEGCTTDAMDFSALYGHLDIVMFLHQHRSEGCTTEAMDGAARRGHLAVVQFLHEHRSEGCTREAMTQAIERGNLDVVEFLAAHRSEGCYARAMNSVYAHDAYGAGDVVAYLESIHYTRIHDDDDESTVTT